MSPTAEFLLVVASSLFLLANSSALSSSVGDLEPENVSDTASIPFECVTGLNETQLERLQLQLLLNRSSAEVDNDTVQVIVWANDSTQGVVARNVQLQIVNDTVLVTGDVPRAESNQVADNLEQNTICEIQFNNMEMESASSKVDKLSGTPPEILDPYNHVVLMNQAPDQVIRCTVSGHPPPQFQWLSDVKATTGTLSEKRNGEHATSYLLFPKVTLNHTGNYTCVAKNEYGTASKTFEVEVISVEALTSRCTSDMGEDDSAASSSNSIEAGIESAGNDSLTRSKRHLWYQWRGTKVYRPPYIHPVDPPHDPIHTDLQKMVNLMAERLNLADKVAVNKWDNNLPVEDVPREEIILENMVRQAQNRGLDPSWAQRFFRDQIEANKDIQFELIRIWQWQGRRPYGPPVDLANDVRPRIDSINNKLINLAKSTQYERRRWKCKPEVEKNARYAAFLYNLDPLHQRALQRACENLCIFQHYIHHERPPYPLN